MRIGQIVAIALIGLGLAAGPTLAADPAEPVKMVKAKLTEVTGIMNNKDIDQDKKRSMIIKSVRPMFDLSLMAKLTLGKKHWTALSEDQRQQFTSLYSAHLEKSSIGKVELYANDRIDFKPPLKKGNKVYVPTELISKGKVMPITYKFYQSKNGWKIYDAEINGTSVVLSNRSEYNAILRNGSIDDLLTKLKQSLTSPVRRNVPEIER